MQESGRGNSVFVPVYKQKKAGRPGLKFSRQKRRASLLKMMSIQRRQECWQEVNDHKVQRVWPILRGWKVESTWTENSWEKNSSKTLRALMPYGRILLKSARWGSGCCCDPALAVMTNPVCFTIVFLALCILQCCGGLPGFDKQQRG